MAVTYRDDIRRRVEEYVAELQPLLGLSDRDIDFAYAVYLAGMFGGVSMLDESDNVTEIKNALFEEMKLKAFKGIT